MVRVKPEVVPEPVKGKTSDPETKVSGNEKKGEAIPVVLPTVKGNQVLTATVLQCGPDVTEVSKGDTVIFSPYGIDEVVINNEKLVVLGEDMVLAYEHKK